MSASLQSLVRSGTKLWLDSIDPQLVADCLTYGATGATSNPIIIADLLKSGRFDTRISDLVSDGLSDHEVAWQLTDELVSQAEKAFLPIWQRTQGNDGYVSFELDPLLEDPQRNLAHGDRVAKYIELGQHWSGAHPNRMIKIPATPAGIDAVEELSAHGVPLNVTLIFTERQYRETVQRMWRGIQRWGRPLKTVYSIFVSRIDVLVPQWYPQLNVTAQGLVGILNAQRIWQLNQRFWADKSLPLEQEIVFASTGTKNPNDAAWKYVAALAGSDIQTNPPATNLAIRNQDSLVFDSKIAVLPSQDLVSIIDSTVDLNALGDKLMSEGIDKFVKPQRELIELIQGKRSAMSEHVA